MLNSYKKDRERKMKKSFILLLLIMILLFIISCDKKTTETEEWDPNGSWAGTISDGDNSGYFETFIIASSYFSANSTITIIGGLEFYEETITLSGYVAEEGNGYELTGNFTISIEDSDGYEIYYSNGTCTGELHLDDDMPFPEGTGSGTTEDDLITISWNIFQTQ